MTMKSLYVKMVDDCEKSLGRGLTNEEKALLKWAEAKEYEALYRSMKSS
ncbi:hypothetical protein [Bacillus sp. JCM 19034]|nr:hypothetical protein [Bacillus sp. JCM 19034]